MKRLLAVTALCLLVTACGGASDDNPVSSDQSGNELNPTALAVETPPTNGRLPADLLPPG